MIDFGVPSFFFVRFSYYSYADLLNKEFLMHRRKDRWMDGRTDGRTDGQTDDIYIFSILAL